MSNSPQWSLIIVLVHQPSYSEKSKLSAFSLINFQIYTFENKLCQRTTNCNVCEAAIKEICTYIKKRSNENVVLDMKLSMEVHEKLSKGVSIDPKVVISLLLCCVINIINQHGELENLDAKVRSIEMYNTTNHIRIKSLKS